MPSLLSVINYFTKLSTKDEPDKVRCVMTYNKNSDPIRAIVDKYWFLLTQDPILGQYVTNRPSITYRRSNSLRDLLVSSHFSEDCTADGEKPSTIPCGCCTYCQYLDTRTTAILPGGIH